MGAKLARDDILETAIAGKPCSHKMPLHRASISPNYNGKCRLNNARNAAGFTGLAR
ncbi:hypothetical protein PHLH4_14860 [Pseudomonas sp. St316]|nr:hypothetical protein PHLH4_14860 [Pseudomonas sp. St316]